MINYRLDRVRFSWDISAVPKERICGMCERARSNHHDFTFVYVYHINFPTFKIAQLPLPYPHHFHLQHHHRFSPPFPQSDPRTYHCAMPMTPQAGRPPAFPVVLLCSCPPLPRSSVPACTTMVRPSTLSEPMSLIWLSDREPLALPWLSVLKLPRSPTWRLVSVGAPCSLEKGLTGASRGCQSCYFLKGGRGFFFPELDLRC